MFSSLPYGPCLENRFCGPGRALQACCKRALGNHNEDTILYWDVHWGSLILGLLVSMIMTILCWGVHWGFPCFGKFGKWPFWGSVEMSFWNSLNRVIIAIPRTPKTMPKLRKPCGLFSKLWTPVGYRLYDGT